MKLNPRAITLIEIAIENLVNQVYRRSIEAATGYTSYDALSKTESIARDYITQVESIIEQNPF